LQPFGVAAGEDDLGALGAGAPGRLETDAGATADQHDGLSEQRRCPLGGTTGGCGGHSSSNWWYSAPITGSSPVILFTPLGHGWTSLPPPWVPVSGFAPPSRWSRPRMPGRCTGPDLRPDSRPRSHTPYPRPEVPTRLSTAAWRANA